MPAEPEQLRKSSFTTKRERPIRCVLEEIRLNLKASGGGCQKIGTIAACSWRGQPVLARRASFRV
ncbi:hypothetical protein [Bradyrhizobium yuanmingense]|uniref:hypothetical protein n=1 Tax=Bradyrhizobium yuanmingense TaxID=108015 RepID=UPI0023B9F1AB|nr:hypothetical protein [Bradyrhizobium yuanmingense]MDF0582147.1 hypothetical protein [Bradyrhizobium yuanmingense]